MGNRTVWIDVREVGQRFGCCGVVRDEVTREVIAETEVCPYGMRGGAFRRAVDLVEARGWEVIPCVGCGEPCGSGAIETYAYGEEGFGHACSPACASKYREERPGARTVRRANDKG